AESVPQRHVLGPAFGLRLGGEVLDLVVEAVVAEQRRRGGVAAQRQLPHRVGEAGQLVVGGGRLGHGDLLVGWAETTGTCPLRSAPWPPARSSPPPRRPHRSRRRAPRRCRLATRRAGRPTSSWPTAPPCASGRSAPRTATGS